MGSRTRLKVSVLARTCPTGKILYERQLEAQIQAERMMELGQVDPGCHVETYACAECRGYHVGNRFIVFPDD